MLASAPSVVCDVPSAHALDEVDRIDPQEFGRRDAVAAIVLW